jgi:outer membrane protein TolC
MKKLAILIFIAATTILAGIELDLQECVQLALENNKELQSAKEEVEVYKQEYRNVRGNLFPQLSLTAGFQHKRTEMPESANFSYIPATSLLDTTATANDQMLAGYVDNAYDAILPEDIQKENSLSSSVKLEQAVFTGGKLINSIKIANKLYNIQEKRYFLVKQDIIYNTKDKYYSAILAQNVVEIKKDALQFAKEYYQKVKKMYNQGLVSEYDLLRAELEVAKLEPEVQEALKNAALALESLKNYLNLEEEISLAGDIVLPNMQEFNLENALQEGLKMRTELELSKINLEVSRLNLRYEKGNFLPNIGITAEYNYFGQNENSIEDDDWGNYYQVGIGFSMPLFTGFSNSAKTAKARHQLKQSQYSHQDLQEKIKLQIRNAYLTWQNNLKKLETQKKNRELAQKGLEIAQTRYENQVSDQLEVFDAQLQVKIARLNYRNSVYDTIMAYEELLKSIGREL